MIKAFIFDLDGTLVQTESIKALSYARAAVKIAPDKVDESQVIENFSRVVGLSRKEVATRLLDILDISNEAEKKKTEYDITNGWKLLVHLRLQEYEGLLSDTSVLAGHACPYNIGLLKWARAHHYATALGTMSHKEQAVTVMQTVKIMQEFDVIITRDEVSNGKPNPEIYELISQKLSIAADRCMVIEDSPAGIEAALTAGMHCIAVTNDITRDLVHDSALLDPDLIVDDLTELLTTVKSCLSRLH